MSEAVNLSSKHVFADMGIHRIEAITHKENVRSRRMLSNLGFTEEGILRDYCLYDGKYMDMVVYSLLANDSEKR